MNRRHLLFLMAACGVAPLHAAGGPMASGIDHLRLGVVDLQRSRNFYGTLFGSSVQDAAGQQVWLKLGASLLQLQQQDTASVLRQSIAFADTDRSELVAWLRAQSLVVEAEDAAGLLLRDRDGVATWVGAASDWNALAASGSSETPAAPIFQPLLIDELFISVTNMQVDSMFYARLLGQTSTAVAGSQFFRIGQHARLRLSQTAVGQGSGFNYFSVLVANTDMDAAAEAVFHAGGIIESFLPNGFSFWDPDGLRVVVRTAQQVLNAPTGALEN